MDKTEIKVSCIDQVLKITDAPIVASGGLSEVRVVFDFCDKWKGFAKTATFYRDIENVYYSVLDENNTCVVPWEVCYESGTFFFGVFGEKENTRRTSVTVRYKVKDGAITAEMTPSDPTPEVYDQIMAMLADMRESQAGFISVAEKAIADANTATQNAQTATANANQATVDANTASTRAYQAAENANASANNANAEAGNAMQATAKANEATTNANKATSDARAATEETNTARENIQQIASEVLSSLSNAVFATPIECSASGEVVTVNDASNQLLRGLSIYGMTVQNGMPTPESPVPLESVGASGAINVTVSGKNLIPNTLVTQTINGVTFTVNEDGSVTANGTATDTTNIYWYNVPISTGKEYRLSGCPAGGGQSVTYMLYAHGYGADEGSSLRFTATANSVNIMLRIYSGVNVSNITFYPMLRLVSIKDSTYEPYKEPQNLTVSTPNGLPGIPVSSGGNYTDENGQAWICDEIDFAKGVYVKRVHQETFATSAMDKIPLTNTVKYGMQTKYESVGGHKSLCSVFSNYSYSAGDNEHFYVDANVYLFVAHENVAAFEANESITLLYDLKTPVETPLPSEELAAFAALHSNKPNTTVFNDGGADMKLTYNADTKLYIDQKISAISAAMLNA